MSAHTETLQQQARDCGLCGEVSPDDFWLCVKEAGHEGRHGDERWGSADTNDAMTKSFDHSALLTTVREALRFKRVEPSASAAKELARAEAALDSLAAELERVKQDRDDADISARLWRDAVERVKAERDALTGRNQFLSTEQVRADVAEARLDKALSALREIAGNHNRCDAGHVKIARRCLAEIEGEAT